MKLNLSIVASIQHFLFRLVAIIATRFGETYRHSSCWHSSGWKNFGISTDTRGVHIYLFRARFWAMEEPLYQEYHKIYLPHTIDNRPCVTTPYSVAVSAWNQSVGADKIWANS